jgi:hypothetical protein
MIMTDVLSIEEYRPVVPGQLTADGEFDGKWSGYEATFTIEGHKLRVRTKDGIRGIDVPCKLIIKDGVAKVEISR